MILTGNILGIGTDIIETERVAEKVAKENGFKEYVFSKGEINYCEKAKRSAEHYAARFAAKEALLKALGTGLSGNYILNEIEVVHNEQGQPYFNFVGATAEHLGTKNILKIHLSMSHQKSMACATVVIEKY